MGILKDHLHPSPHVFQRMSVESCDISAIKKYTSTRWLNESQDQPAHCRFSAATLSDETQNFPLSKGEAHVVYRTNDFMVAAGKKNTASAFTEGKVLVQAFDTEQHILFHDTSLINTQDTR